MNTDDKNRQTKKGSNDKIHDSDLGETQNYQETFLLIRKKTVLKLMSGVMIKIMTILYHMTPRLPMVAMITQTMTKRILI